MKDFKSIPAPDAPITEEEMAEAEALRAALEREDDAHADASFLRAVRALHTPEDLSAHEHALLVATALDTPDASKRGQARPATLTLVRRISYAAVPTLAAAATVMFVIRGAEMAPKSETASAVLSESAPSAPAPRADGLNELALAPEPQAAHAKPKVAAPIARSAAPADDESPGSPSSAAAARQGAIGGGGTGSGPAAYAQPPAERDELAERKSAEGSVAAFGNAATKAESAVAAKRPAPAKKGGGAAADDGHVAGAREQEGAARARGPSSKAVAAGSAEFFSADAPAPPAAAQPQAAPPAAAAEKPAADKATAPSCKQRCDDIKTHDATRIRSCADPDRKEVCEALGRALEAERTEVAKQCGKCD